MGQWLVRVWPLALTVVILAPLAAPGYVLTYDMVFVPDQDLRPDFFGFREGVPRAVPSDAVIAMLSVALPGQVIQKALLAGIVAGGAAGVLRLTRGAPLVVRLVSSTAFVWNPYVAERLLIGQWAVLVSYAALPWVVVAALSVRRGSPSAWAATVVAVAVSAMSPSGGVVAMVVALCVALWRGSGARRRDAVFTVLGTLAVNAPWVVAGLLSADRAVTGGAGVEAFAARSEGHLPVWATVATLGGIWNSGTVPDSRETWVPLLWLLLLITAILLGWRGLGSHVGSAARAALTMLAALSFVVALVGVFSPSLVASVMDTVPGLALFRDGTRYLGPLALFQSLSLGFAAGWLVSRMTSRALQVIVAAACVLAPAAVLPDLGWGVGGRLEPTSYPASWVEARAAMEADDRPGDALVLPLSPYRAYSWNDGSPGLDPAGRYFPVITRSSNALRVDGDVVQQEDPSAARAAALFDAGDVAGLAAEGVGFVIIDAEPTELSAHAEVLGLDALFATSDLAVFAVPGSEPSDASLAQIVVVSMAWAASLSVLVWALFVATRRRDRHHSEGVARTR